MENKKRKFQTVEELIKYIDPKRKKFLTDYILLNAIGTNNFDEFKTIEQLNKVEDYLDNKEFEYSEWYEKNPLEAKKYEEFYDACYDCCDYLYSLCDETYECVGGVDNAKD